MQSGSAATAGGCAKGKSAQTMQDLEAFSARRNFGLESRLLHANLYLKGGKKREVLAIH
jgi:hypothetical protein